MYHYQCEHYREHFWYCYANSTYEAAQKAAKHWGRKNTCGIDVYRVDQVHKGDM